MSDGQMNQELLSMWKRSMDQGIEVWQKLIAQPQTADISQFMRPLWGQSMDLWTQILQQGASSPDAIVQWKKFLDDSIEVWSKVLGQAMETEGFARAMGQFMDQYLNTVGPIRKGLQSSNEEFLKTMNLPSRTQVVDLASHVVSLEDRLESLEERIEDLVDSISLLEALVKRGASA